MNRAISNDGETDFGSYLVTVYERDIDLLLMEEFHVSSDFVAWFAKCTNVENATFDGAWHSVTDVDGETDLLLRVRTSGGSVGILIENKIAAPEQQRQDERYHLRAARAQQQRKFDSFATCICAPQAYLDGVRNDCLYQFQISYEAIAEWFGGLDGPRHAWRHRIMREAIRQGRRGYTMVVNSTVSDFHLAFWDYVQRHHPMIVMRRPTQKGSKSNWIVMKGLDFPARVQLHFKLDQRVVELGFGGRQVAEIRARKGDWPKEVRLVQKQGTAALSIPVPFVDLLKPLADQLGPLEEVFRALSTLLPYGRLLDDSP